jgi:hypothetical protein
VGLSVFVFQALSRTHSLVLSLVPNYAGEVRSAWPVLVFFLQGWVKEGTAKQCLYCFRELPSSRGKPVGSKGAVGEHTAIGVHNESSTFFRNTS